MRQPTLAVTPGEPAGIGPDILIQAVQQGSPYRLVAYADRHLLTTRANHLGLPLNLLDADSHHDGSLQPGELLIKPIPCPEPATPGAPNQSTANYILQTLTTAVADCQSGAVDALVTGPVNKAIINDAGTPFTGHTEFLAQQTNTEQVVMMLASSSLRVALATTHLPLQEVAGAITQSLLEQVINTLNHDLRHYFGITKPRILVCGLNPHAGEGGHLGTEEITTIQPVLNRLREQGYHLEGPLPADTLFTPKVLEGADAVLAMYHDQGLPVLKYSGFGQSANITLGLPIIRTSVDHGTALDLAGSGQANPGSLLTAIEQAALMANARQSQGAPS